MIFYLLVALLPLLVCHRYDKLPEHTKTLKIRDQYLFWTLIAIFLTIAFRHYSMGTDTNGYLEDFVRFANLDWKAAIDDTRMEPGYVVFSKIIAYITSSPKVFQVIYVAIYFLCYYSFVQKFEGLLPFYFLFFFVALGEYTFFFTGVRQCLAISLCLFSYRFVLSKKWYFFLLTIAVAYTIHHSVVLFLIVYPLSNRKITYYNILLYLGVLYFASNYLLLAQMYLNDKLDYNYEIEAIDSGLIFMLLLFALTIISFIYVIYKNRNVNKIITILFNVNIVTLFFWVLRLQTRVAERPSFYFLPFSCMLFAYVLKDCKDNIVRIGMVIVPLLYFAYRFTTTFKLFVPYKTFFFD